MIRFINNIFSKFSSKFSSRIKYKLNIMNTKIKISKNEDIFEKKFLNTKKIKLNDVVNNNGEVYDYRSFRNFEKDVYITELINNNNNKFNFELKKYFSDFIVHEISVNGDLIQLNDFDIDRCKLFSENKKSVLNLDNCLLDIDKNRIKLFDEDILNKSSIDIDVTNFDKNKRKAIHLFVDNNYKNLCTSTIDLKNNNVDKKVIRVQKFNSKEDKKRYKKQKNKEEDFYLHFNLYQENRGTIQAVLDITKNLNLNSKNISYTGTKDKRSISTQRCCLYKTKVERLLEYNKKASKYKFPVVLGNFSYQKDKCFLGQLAGNRFDLILRNAEIDSLENFEKCIQNLKKNGFINYFGLQRFGHNINSTYKIGLLLLKKSYFEAINLILNYRSKDLRCSNDKFPKSFNECLKIYKEQNDAKTAYKEFYWKNFNEGWLLKGLSLYENNYINAFNLIPRNSRLLYCHAYQSYIWNRIASYRFKTYGLKVVLGDLVTFKNYIQDGKLVNDSKFENYNAKNEEEENELKEEIDEVIIIDDSNIDKFTIYDVILPLIGSKVKLPNNLVKEEYIKALKEDNLSFETFENSNVKLFLTGKYRRFLIKPLDLNYKILDNKKKTSKRLISTDLDKIKNELLVEDKFNFKNDNQSLNYLIKLSFSLLSSSYATIMLRELSGSL